MGHSEPSRPRLTRPWICHMLLYLQPVIGYARYLVCECARSYYKLSLLDLVLMRRT
jgi:hypothetical protein